MRPGGRGSGRWGWKRWRATTFQRKRRRLHHPGTDSPPLVALLQMALDEEAWEAFSRGSAIRRAGRAGFARNVCVAMGNWLAGEELPPLQTGAEAEIVLIAALSDPEALVRGHAAWALGRVGSAAARAALSARASLGPDDSVRSELAAALLS
jgi:epoxyqueuosine reductase